MTEQEAQQAETVAEIRTRHIVPDVDEGKGGPVANPDCVSLLKIVDSQAQKIEAMQKQLNAYSLATQAAGSLMQKQYTEEELRPVFEECFTAPAERARKSAGCYTSKHVENDWQAMLRFARFLGAIKEKKG